MTMYTSLTIDIVLYIHERIIERAGGKQGIRDFSLLHSALERCKATCAGEDLYPELIHKAAALWHSLTMNHAFLDGNKRTAFVIMSRFLNENGLKIVADQDEIVRICISLDNDGLKLKEIVEWLESHTSEY